MTDTPDVPTVATVEQVEALVGHDGDERFDDLLVVLAGDEADVTTWQGQRIAAIVATLTDAQITELCEAYDLCPLHRCDIGICGDDDAPECRDYRTGRRPEAT
jgi:hypothetical protein